MASIKDVLAYFCRNYPEPDHLSKARITKMVYLADWKSALECQQQVTGITWEFNHYGPYVSDIERVARKHPEVFRIRETETFFGNRKEVIELADPAFEPELDDDERLMLDHVIRTTPDLDWADFIRLVYSTYPIHVEERYSTLDLVALAERHKKERQAIREAKERWRRENARPQARAS